MTNDESMTNNENLGPPALDVILTSQFSGRYFLAFAQPSGLAGDSPPFGLPFEILPSTISRLNLAEHDESLPLWISRANVASDIDRRFC